jgi:glutamine amidotransferase
MIAIIDYSMGNVASIVRMLKKLGVNSKLTRDPDEISAAEKLILPGVGAFDTGMRSLADSRIKDVLKHIVIVERKPVLGICLGMQLLFNHSEEGVEPGLGWIDGDVKRFRFSGEQKEKVPHMGWNVVMPSPGNPLFVDLTKDARFYFVHSYFTAPNDSSDIAATTEHGFRFCCAVSHGNIHGVQFHPEKSHKFGLQLLRNFAGL